MSTDLAKNDDNMAENVATDDDDDDDRLPDDVYADLVSTDYDDDYLDELVDLKLLKVSAKDFKNLTSEKRVKWATAHFIIQKFAYLFKPREEEVSKEEEESKDEEESKEEEDDIEEESKVPKTDDYHGGSGPRGTSWKRSSKPGV